jgi:glycosyltransferase involved in cell wall biosynthesis
LNGDIAARVEAAPSVNEHILFVTKLLPTPADSGGKQRTLATLRRFSELGDVSLIAFDDGADQGALNRLGMSTHSVRWPTPPWAIVGGYVRSRSLSSARFWHHDLARAAEHVARMRPPDVLVVEYVQLAPLVRNVHAPRTVLSMHNVESDLVASVAFSRRLPTRALLWAEAAAVRRLERRLLRVADIVSVVSETDRVRLPRSRARVIVCPNGTEHPELLPWRHDEPTALFVAQLGWTPNVDGALWLGRKVWPLVRAARPDARLLLVGRQPAPAVRDLAAPDVEVAGTVPNVQPFLARARCSLAPLHAGGGSRLKILESLAAGRPVVATSVGAEGLGDLVGHGIVVADDPPSFADAVVALLDDADRAKRLGKAGHDRVAMHYTWDTTLAPLLDAVFAPNR